MARKLLEKARARQSLKKVLQRHVQRWRIPILTEHGGIVIERPREHIRVTDQNFEVLEGDNVMLDDPLPPACKKALADRAKTDRLDYFVLPNTPDDLFIKNLRLLLNFRTLATTFATDIDTLQKYVEALHLRADFPIRNIIIGCHATHNADLLISFKDPAQKHTRYEDIERSNEPSLSTAGGADSKPDSGKLIIHEEALLPRPVDSSGTAIPVTLYIFGCYMGRYKRFLEETKKAFGPGISRVWASKFMIATEPTPNPEGIMEFLLYEYMVTRPKPVAARTALVRAFEAGGFTIYDDRTAVANTSWEGWIPRDITQDGRGGRMRMVRPDPLPPANMHAKFLHDTLEIPESTVASNVDRPATDKELQSEGLRLIKPRLERMEKFKDTHPFSMSLRLGYEDLDKLIEGFSWTARFVPGPTGSKGDIKVKGLRHEYMLRVPVLRGDNLILNWYPVDKRNARITMLREDDTNFFTTV